MITKSLRNTLLAGLVSLVVSAAGANAQTYVYVPSDTPATGGANAWPFSAHANWRYQILVPAYSLPSTTLKVAQIAFAGGKNATFTSPDFQIRIAHRTAPFLSTNFDSNFDHPPIVCYDGAINYDTTMHQWSPIGLTNSFAYDGVRNVVIEVRYRNGSKPFMTIQHGGTTRAWINTGTDPYTATNATHTGGGPKVRLRKAFSAVISTWDSVSTGMVLPIDIVSATMAGKKFQLANSFSQGTLPVGRNQNLNLGADPLFWTSIFAGPPIFNGYSGTLGQRQARASLRIPDLSALTGVKIYTAGVVYDNNGILDVTNTDVTTIVRRR